MATNVQRVAAASAASPSRSASGIAGPAWPRSTLYRVARHNMKSLANAKGVLLDESDYFGVKRFSDSAIERFPEFAIELTDAQRDVHGQMHVLAQGAREGMRIGDLDSIRRIFDFLEQLLDRSDLHGEIVDAVTISFLTPEAFQLSTHGAQAWSILTPKLRTCIEKAL